MVMYVDWLYGGKDPRHAAWLETSRRVFDGLYRYLSPDGVLRNTPGNTVVRMVEHRDAARLAIAPGEDMGSGLLGGLG